MDGCFVDVSSGKVRGERYIFCKDQYSQLTG